MTYDDAIAWAGGTQTKLAERLGIKQPAVSAWGGVIPAEHQMRLERMSCGVLRADPEAWEPAKEHL